MSLGYILKCVYGYSSANRTANYLFYSHNLNASTEFYEQMLGLELWLDQKASRVYTVSRSGYLGFCQASETSSSPADKQSSVIFTKYSLGVTA